MSFAMNGTPGQVYAPGWFLENNEAYDPKTRTIKQDHAQAKTAEDGGKYVPMGAIYPANDGTAEGIVYEDVDVSTGDMPGSVVLSGKVYLDRLPEAPAEAAKTALEGKGFKFTTASPAVTRPY